MRTLDLETDKMLAHVDEGVGWITFNQPEKRNAVSYAMWQAIPQIIEDFNSSEDVRVVVMSGAGDRAFVSGADISEFEKLRNTPEQIEIYDAATSASNKALRSLDKPLIAMIRGFCVGGGLAISLAADLRISADDGQFGVPAAKLGLGYGYAGIKELMNIVGPIPLASRITQMLQRESTSLPILKEVLKTICGRQMLESSRPSILPVLTWTAAYEMLKWVIPSSTGKEPLSMPMPSDETSPRLLMG